LIETLRIAGIAVVEKAELEFGPGLNVLTGETGAGKSIVLGALGLLVGARASADTLRAGVDEGVVEAIFATRALPDLVADLAGRGLEPGEQDEGHLIVQRTLSRRGRSRSRVSDQLVQVSSLAQLFTGRVEISSQHSSQALLRPETHGLALDEAGGLLDLREAVRQHYEAVVALDGEIAELRLRADESARQEDFLRFQIDEIDSLDLQPGELEELSREHSRLAHADRLHADGGGALAALVGDPSQGGDSSADRLEHAVRALEQLAALDAGLEEPTSRLQDCAAELRDCAGDLERYLDGVESDPARLAAVDERLHQIERLGRKYAGAARSASTEGPASERAARDAVAPNDAHESDPAAHILAYRARIAVELEECAGADERIVALCDERVRRVAVLASDAMALSEGREKAAQKLGRKVQKSLRELGMPDARFRVSLERAGRGNALPAGVESGPSGLEAPEFVFAATGEEPLRPIHRVASGGELSRVFLAVKNALRKNSAGMVLVFDEVDAGIGGGVAERVGRVLAELAAHHQVLCITHLPQIAAFADRHFRIVKSGRGAKTLARVELLEGDQRAEEIARMAGGESVTAATRDHARELLGLKAPA
jgi:DNA repair protein RecN (Recombination protein N)